MEAIFSRGGPLARAHPAFEARTGQVEMAQAVEAAFEEKEHLVVQAGTGLGKTFAYLIPALRHALKHKKRVVISTRTINLQEQIIKKDIPFLRECLGKEYPFVAVLAKGRGNYVCLNKMQYLQDFDRGLFTSLDQVNALRRLREVLDSGQAVTGDRDELFQTASPEIWPHICGDGESCLRRHCPYIDDCYYYAARRLQLRADLVVVNHALFFSDLSIRKDSDFQIDQGVLEDYDAVVFDEAHNLEDVATDFFSKVVDSARVKRVTSFVQSSFREGGILHRPENSNTLELLEGMSQKVNAASAKFFADFHSTQKLVAEMTHNSPMLEDNLADLIKHLAGMCGTGVTDEENAMLLSLHRSVSNLLEDLRFVSGVADAGFAYWVEMEYELPVLKAAPISLEDDLRSTLFERLDTVVLTSATLSSVLLRRIGLEECRLMRLDSPFDYRSNCLLYLPSNAKDPRDHGFDAYAAASIIEIANASRGRALVLFTSYRAMNETFELVQASPSNGFNLLRQGEFPQRELLRRFTAAEGSLLFAVSSYWEGVDIPGEALSCVILVKLPFSVPTEPMMEARFEKIVEVGKDPFREYSLPQAVLRLKQGFGRLIRSTQDRGVVAILDNRVQKKQYGKLFLRELPSARIVRSIEEVTRFFSKQSREAIEEKRL